MLQQSGSNLGPHHRAWLLTLWTSHMDPNLAPPKLPSWSWTSIKFGTINLTLPGFNDLKPVPHQCSKHRKLSYLADKSFCILFLWNLLVCLAPWMALLPISGFKQHALVIGKIFAHWVIQISQLLTFFMIQYQKITFMIIPSIGKLFEILTFTLKMEFYHRQQTVFLEVTASLHSFYFIFFSFIEI